MASEYLEQIGAVATLGASGGGGFFAVKWFAEWIAGRIDKKEAALDAGWKQYRETLERDLASIRAEMSDLKEQLWECQRKHAEADAKVLRLEAIIQSKGDVAQRAQRIASADRLEQAGILPKIMEDEQ